MWTSIPYMKHLSKMGNEDGRGRDCYLTLPCCQQRYEPGSNTVMPASDLQLATLGFIWNYPLFVNQYFIIVHDDYCNTRWWKIIMLYRQNIYQWAVFNVKLPEGMSPYVPIFSNMLKYISIRKHMIFPGCQQKPPTKDSLPPFDVLLWGFCGLDEMVTLKIAYCSWLVMIWKLSTSRIWLSIVVVML